MYQTDWWYLRSTREAGTITNLQLWSWRRDGRTYTAETPTSVDSKNKRVASSSSATHQTLQKAERNWRRRPHSSCRLDSQCSGDREKESSTLNWVKTRVVVVMVVDRNWTIFSCDVIDLCADQRSRVRGYEDCLPHGPSFRLLLRSNHSGFVSTVSTLFCWFVD